MESRNRTIEPYKDTFNFDDQTYKTPVNNQRQRIEQDFSWNTSERPKRTTKENFHRSPRSRDHSGSTRSLKNSYELLSHSPLDRKREIEEYTQTLKSQISEKEKLKQQREEMSKSNAKFLEKQEDERYLTQMLTYSPFGKMGAGAPLRDKTGHLLAERGHMVFQNLENSFDSSSPRNAYNNINDSFE